MRFKRVSLLVLSFCVIIACKKAAVKEEYGDLEGIIRDESGKPLADAQVKISSTSIYSTFSPAFVASVSDGKYLYNGLPVNNSQLINEYSVTVSRTSYQTKTQIVKITANSTNKLDFVLSKSAHPFTVSDSLVNVNGSAASFDINVTCDGTWTIKNSAAWLTCLKKDGTGDDRVGFSCSPNPELTDRRDTVEFISGTVTRRLVVVQSAPVVLVSYKGALVKNANTAPDTVYLQFNKLVIVESIKVTTPLLYPDVDGIIYFDNNKGVRFLYPMQLGKNYTFAVSANDGKGNFFKKDVTIQF